MAAFSNVRRSSFVVRPSSFWRQFGVCLAVGIAGGAAVAFVNPVYVFAALAGLIAAAIVLRSTQWGLYAVIGVVTLLPFAAVPLNVGFNPTFLDLATLGLYFVWLARLMTRRQERPIGSPLSLPLLGFILLAVFSFVAGLAYAGLTRDTARHFVELLLAIGIFFVVVNVVQDQYQLEGAFKALMIAGFLAAAIGVVLYVLPDETALRLLSPLRWLNYKVQLRYIENNPSLPERAIGTSTDPNVFGGLLLMAAALTAPQLFAKRPLIPRLVAWPMLGIIGLCLVLTFSRGSMAGLAVTLVFIATLRYRRLLGWMALAAAVFLVIPWSRDYVLHFIQGVQGQDLATKMRFGEYKDAFILIGRYPWFGVGFVSPPDIDLYLGVSSFYLLLAEQMGLVGLAAFLGIIGLFFITAVDAWHRVSAADERLAAMMLGGTAALLGAMVGGIFDHYFVNLDFPHAVTLFWLTVGLTMAAARLGGEPTGQISELRPFAPFRASPEGLKPGGSAPT
jgi:O-antigen ligase